jgi:flagellar basal-body rod protein FlgB
LCLGTAPDLATGGLSVEDLAISALTGALNGLAVRQRYIAADTANIETPNYLAHRVDFESSLRTAVANGTTPAATSPVVQTSLEPTRSDGNNVNLDEETLQSVDTGLRYQLASQAVTNTFARLRSSIDAGGGA